MEVLVRLGYTGRVNQKTLLVALSLVLPCAAVADDKHKQPSGRSGKAKRFIAYAYSSGRLTSLGEKPVAGVTIAADPRVLPMGSRVRISGAGAYSGVYRVGDVGPNIKGQKIDVFVRSYQEAKLFGRKDVEVTLLSVPRQYARRRTCKGCETLEAKAIISIDEARGSSPSPARRSIPSRGVGDGAGESDQGEGGSSPAFAGLPSLERTSAN